MRGTVAIITLVVLAGCTACTDAGQAAGPATSTIAPQPVRPGTTWVAEPFPQRHHGHDEIAGVSSGDGVTWAFGSWYENMPVMVSQAFRRDPDGWHEVPIPDIGPLGPSAIVSRNDVWVISTPTKCCQSIALHWDGQGWTERPLPASRLGTSLYDLIAFGPDQVWILGAQAPATPGPGHTTVVMRWDGSTWRNVPLPPAATNLWLSHLEGTGPNDLWAVGTTGTSPADMVAFHWDGTRWSKAVLPAADGPDRDELYVNDVAARASDDVWIAATLTPVNSKDPNFHRPVLLHWNGKAWTREHSPQDTPQPTAEAGFLKAGKELWLFGKDIYRYDGRHWQRVESPPGLRPRTGTVLPDGRVLVVCPTGEYQMNGTAMELWV